LLLAILVYLEMISLAQLRSWLIWPSLVYFGAATRWAILRERQDASDQAQVCA
jgi:hypothetical protein